ncbi:MAG: cyclase [Isosphaeraceae bacterium]|jgi:kynurenine formamidase|nr:MAG: cyclase [Isosphaeraceae bacterium]
MRVVAAVMLVGAGVVVGISARPSRPEIRGWEKGRGWGWIWGAEDEVGSLNAMTDATRLAALRGVREGKVYDLGLPYSRRSYKFPGHSPGEIMSFRSPEGLERESRQPGGAERPAFFWHSNALFLSDNVATQLDGLAHIVMGEDHHWYNGFREADWGSDFGVRKCDADSIPPIIARGVLIDVAAWKGVDVLPGGTLITTEDLKATLAWEGVELEPGDVVLVRTGSGRNWGEDGADHAAIAASDSSGPGLEATRWLVEEHGAILVGSDTSGYEGPAPPGTKTVHEYLLVEQGVHLGELHNLEELSRDRVYTFCYIALTNRIKGATAGFAMRPIAVR